MTGSPLAAVITGAALAAILVITIAFIWAEQRDDRRHAAAYEPRHTHRPPEVHHAAAAELPAPGRLDMLPPDPPPADTGELPHAVCVWGMPADELLDDLARKYLQVQR